MPETISSGPVVVGTAIAPTAVRAQFFRAIQSACILAVLAGVTFHALVLWFDASPYNYYKLKYASLISSYSGRVLFQNWAFFAPTPVDRDYALLVRVIDGDGHVSQWYDLSAGLVQEMQRNRLSAYETVNAGVSNALLGALQLSNNGHLNEGNAQQFTETRLLYRVSASYLKARAENASFPTKIQIGIRTSEFPRFTHRNETKMKVSLNVLPWQVFPSDVTGAGW